MHRLPPIDQVDWSTLTCSCGNARHVPSALYGLCSTDLSTAEQSYWNLEDHVVEHGQLFTAAEPIAEIIVALWPHATYQALLANLLYQIGSAASGCSDSLSVRCLERVLSAYHDLLSRESLDPEWRESMSADYQDLQDQKIS